ncbi:MAG: MFS transporter [Candidatus Riflebacteria bacterium]|nr:MFS transporter [Candidatus Riflebacteria bacterium]
MSDISNLIYPSKSPWWYVPSLYFQQGLPVIIIQQVSVLMYKKMGIQNDQIGLWTSLIIWPWILKMLWAPFLDLHGKKRSWVIAMQVLITASLGGAALAITTQSFLVITLIIFFVTAFFSATHDIALDGYYMLALSKNNQAFYAGIRSTFFRLAMVFSNGFLVMVAGYFENKGMPISETWRMALLAGTATYGILLIFALRVMPKVVHDGPVKKSEGEMEHASIKEVFFSFFRLPKIVPVMLFILLYRFGESMLTKMVGPFMLDPHSKGGLGLDTLQVGIILGNVGVICLVAGGVLGGIVISRYGFRKSIWPMVIVMTIPNFFYIWVAHTLPPASFIYILTAVEYFSYGFGMTAYMVFAMYCSQKSKYATSHYAIVTGVMALGSMIAGIISGYLQQAVGYFWFFICVCFATIPSIIVTKFIPLEVGDENAEKV